MWSVKLTLSSSVLSHLNCSGSRSTCCYRWRPSIKCSLEQHFLPKLSGKLPDCFALFSLFFGCIWRCVVICSHGQWCGNNINFLHVWLRRILFCLTYVLHCSLALNFLEILPQTPFKSLLSKFSGSHIDPTLSSLSWSLLFCNHFKGLVQLLIQ